jgi:hypothetical protein
MEAAPPICAASAGSDDQCESKSRLYPSVAVFRARVKRNPGVAASFQLADLSVPESASWKLAATSNTVAPRAGLA